jgi:hypothetical protein
VAEGLLLATLLSMNHVSPVELYTYLREKSVSKVHALGMLANIKEESNFDAGVQERGVTRGRGGFGLFQHAGARRRALERYCERHEKELWDWRAQIDFALTESSTDRYLAKMFASAEDATRWWTIYWERPAKAEQKAKKRIRYLGGLEELISQ